jgi:hypothetical protein
MIYQQGQPAIVDAGVGTYTRDTFNGRVRYTLWPIRGSAHNAPVINGVEQAAGREFAARDVIASDTPEQAKLSMNLTAAYPPEAGVTRLTRSITLSREGQGRVTVHDEYELAAAPGVLEVNLLTPCQPHVTGEGQIHLQSQGLQNQGRILQLNFAKGSFAVELKTHQLTEDDGNLYSSWGKTLHRIVLTHHATQTQGSYDLTFHPVSK